MELNLGSKIREVAKKKKISTISLAQKIPMTRQNLDKIYRKKSVDTGLLFLISKALEYDFFKYCSQQFKGKFIAGLESSLLVSEPKGDYDLLPEPEQLLVECKKEKANVEEKLQWATETSLNQRKVIEHLEAKLKEEVEAHKNIIALKDDQVKKLQQAVNKLQKELDGALGRAKG